MIYYDNKNSAWKWDRWMVGNGTPIPEWMVRHFHKSGEEEVILADIWRLD